MSTILSCLGCWGSLPTTLLLLLLTLYNLISTHNQSNSSNSQMWSCSPLDQILKNFLSHSEYNEKSNHGLYLPEWAALVFLLDLISFHTAPVHIRVQCHILFHYLWTSQAHFHIRAFVLSTFFAWETLYPVPSQMAQLLFPPQKGLSFLITAPPTTAIYILTGLPQFFPWP